MDKRTFTREKQDMAMKTHSIYIIKNTINDKVYIGQTCQSVEERFRQHLKPSTHKLRGSFKIYNAMKKYGKENFYIETLETNINSADIDKKEIEYIEKYNSYKCGYNSTKGGDGKTIIKIQDIEKFKKMYFDKKEYGEIAKEFNVCKETVVRTIKALNLPKRANVLTKEYLFEVKNSKTNIEIAKEFNINEETVSRAFKKYGIKRGKGCSNHLNIQNISRTKKDMLEKLWYDKTKSIQDISKELKVHPRTLFRYAEKYNLKKRKELQ